MSSRVLMFADGFSSATTPNVSGGVQEDYTIANATTGGAILTLDSALNRTVFVNYELKRETSLSNFIQSGQLVFLFTDESGWFIAEGLLVKDDAQDQMLTQDAIVNVQDVQLLINSVTGVLTYNSGNIAGTGYVGTFKLNITRIS